MIRYKLTKQQIKSKDFKIQELEVKVDNLSFINDFKDGVVKDQRSIIALQEEQIKLLEEEVDLIEPSWIGKIWDSSGNYIVGTLAFVLGVIVSGI
jgi:hypothetical protein